MPIQVFMYTKAIGALLYEETHRRPRRCLIHEFVEEEFWEKHKVARIPAPQ